MDRRQEIRDALTARGATVDYNLNVANPNGGRPFATIARYSSAGGPPLPEQKPGQYYKATIPNFGREIKLRPGDDVGVFADHVLCHDFSSA